MRDSGIDNSHSLYGLVDSFSSRLLDARSDNTVKKYGYGFDKWKAFAAENNLVSMPAAPIHVALFFVKLLDSGAKYNTVCSIYYSLKWAHEMC